MDGSQVGKLAVSLSELTKEQKNAAVAALNLNKGYQDSVDIVIKQIQNGNLLTESTINQALASKKLTSAQQDDLSAILKRHSADTEVILLQKEKIGLVSREIQDKLKLSDTETKNLAASLRNASANQAETLTLKQKASAITSLIGKYLAFAAVSAVIGLVATHIKNLNKALDDNITASKEASEQIKSNKTEIEDLNTQLQETGERLAILRGISMPTLAEQDDTIELEKQNAELETRIQLLKIQNDELERQKKISSDKAWALAQNGSFFGNYFDASGNEIKGSALGVVWQWLKGDLQGGHGTQEWAADEAIKKLEVAQERVSELQDIINHGVASDGEYEEYQTLVEETIPALTGSLSKIATNFKDIGTSESLAYVERIAYLTAEAEKKTAIFKSLWDGIESDRQEQLINLAKNGKLTKFEIEGIVGSETADKFDNLTGSIESTVREIKNMGKESANTAVGTNALKDAISGTENDVNTVISALSTLNRDSNAFNSLFSGEGGEDALQAILDVLPELQDELQRYSAGLIGSTELQNDFLRSLAISQLEGLKTELDSITDAYDEFGSTDIGLVQESLEGLETIFPGISRYLNANAENYSKVRDAALGAASGNDEAAKSLIAMGKVANQIRLDEIAREYKEAFFADDSATMSSLSAERDQLQVRNQLLDQMGDYTSYLHELEEANREFADSFDNLSGKLSSVDSALEEQKESGKLSAQTIVELAKAGYAAAISFDEATGAAYVNEEAAIALANAQLQAAFAEDLAALAASDVATETENAGTKTSAAGDKFKTFGENAAAGALGAVDFASAMAVVNAELTGQDIDIGEKEAQFEALVNAYRGAADAVSGGFFSTGSRKSSKNSKDHLLESYQTEIARLDHLREMDQINEATYYNDKLAALQTYLKDRKKYQEQWWDWEEEFHNYQKQLIEDEIDQLEDQRDKQIDTNEEYYKNLKKQKEKEYDLEKDRVDKVIDALEKELDAKKKSIQKQRDLLDEQADDREYNKSIEQKNKEIADIKAQLTVLDLDDSAEAKAKKIALQEELTDKLNDLEDYQYDHSIDTQKNALDKQETYWEDHFGKLIEAQELYLENLKTMYDQTIESIESSMEAMTNSIKASFESLIAAKQSLLNNAGSIPGMAEITPIGGGSGDDKSGSNEYKVKEGDNLSRIAKAKGTSVSKLLELNPWIKDKNKIYPGQIIKYHDGGVVGKSINDKDKEVLSQIIPVSRDEVLAKLLRGEVVVNEKQQGLMRDAWMSIAPSMALATKQADMAKALASNVTTNNSPNIVFDMKIEVGNTDAAGLSALQRQLENFKNEAVKAVYERMSNHRQKTGRINPSGRY